ncbi:bile acid:sodium symporter family protein [Thalassotalea piscium]
MEASIFTQVLLPIAIALIMFGMGLGLTVQDFTRLAKAPRAIFAGLLGQIVLMPLLAFALCLFFELDAPIAIGIMILAACPGGTMSNVFSQLAKANLALSVSLTAISTFICVFSTPFIIQFAVNNFSGVQQVEFSLVQTALGLFLVTLVPVIMGICIRHYYKHGALKAEVYFRRFSLIFMVLMILALVIKEIDLLVASFDQVFFACLALNLLSIVIGLLLAKVCNLTFVDAITLAIEVGIQNATLAILIAISFLNAPEFAVSAGVYGLAMYIGPLLLVLWVKFKRNNQEELTSVIS